MSTSEDSSKEPLNVYSLIAVMLDQAASVAWQKLGLQHDMITGAIEKDLDQARVAIDLVANLSQQLEPQLDESDQRRIKSLLSDLRVNFLEQTKGVNS